MDNPSDSGGDLDPAGAEMAIDGHDLCPGPSTGNTLFVQQGLSSPKQFGYQTSKLNLAVIRRNKQLLIV